MNFETWPFWKKTGTVFFILGEILIFSIIFFDKIGSESSAFNLSIINMIFGFPAGFASVYVSDFLKWIGLSYLSQQMIVLPVVFGIYYFLFGSIIGWIVDRSKLIKDYSNVYIKIVKIILILIIFFFLAISLG